MYVLCFGLKVDILGVLPPLPAPPIYPQKAVMQRETPWATSSWLSLKASNGQKVAKTRTLGRVCLDSRAADRCSQSSTHASAVRCKVCKVFCRALINAQILCKARRSCRGLS